MPITSIWPIKGSYVQALSYIVNPMKTEAKDGIVAELEDVLDYVSNGEKTNQKYYVTGINCDPDSAAESFRKTKIAFDKPDGVLAFHTLICPQACCITASVQEVVHHTPQFFGNGHRHGSGHGDLFRFTS